MTISNPKNDGEWIEWGGGECPVEPETRVDVRFRGSIAGIDMVRNEAANYWLWGHGTARGAAAHPGDDIIAYRVVQP